MNHAMHRMIQDGEAIDVLTIGTTTEQPGVYELRAEEVGRPNPRDPEGRYQLDAYRDGIDLCDLGRELWIWSVGLEIATGRVFAATDARYYGREDYQCLWMR